MRRHHLLMFIPVFVTATFVGWITADAIGSPYRLRRPASMVNVRAMSRPASSASSIRPRYGIRCSRT